MNATEILQQCTITGDTVFLPPVQLERKLYLEVAKKLELIGGKWNRKANGFIFPPAGQAGRHDPTELLAQIAGGEQRNLKKEFQFFPTPEHLAVHLVELAQPEPHHRILEPSAGQGAIIKAITKKLPNVVVDCYELMELNQTFLEQIPNARLIGADFLQSSEQKQYDRIIANPPFAHNQDIDHIRAMFDRLNDGGRLVSLASKHWQLSGNSKEKQFGDWLKQLKAHLYEVPAGQFKTSGTMIASVIIAIDKLPDSGLLQCARQLGLILQKNAFYGYTVFHGDCAEAIGGFVTENGVTQYSSLLSRQSIITGNYEQGLKFILRAYNSERARTITAALQKNQMQIF